MPPALTIEAIGTRRALQNARTLTVEAGEGPFAIPIPSLMGAIILKAQVAGAVASRPKHERDLARLRQSRLEGWGQADDRLGLQR